MKRQPRRIAFRFAYQRDPANAKVPSGEQISCISYAKPGAREVGKRNQMRFLPLLQARGTAAIAALTKRPVLAVVVALGASACGTTVTTTTQFGSKPAEVRTQTVGSLLGLSNGSGSVASSTYAAHVIEGDASIPDAAFFTQGHHLLREYYSRSGEPVPDAAVLAANIANGSQPLYALAGQYRSDPNAFNRKRAGELLVEEATRALVTEARSSAIAFWRPIRVEPYNFETGQFTLCLFEGCNAPRDTTLSLTYGTRDYALLVDNVPAKLSIAPHESVAREIEHAAAMQSPRGMRALLVAQIPKDSGNSASDRKVRAQLSAVFLYRREHFAETEAVPDQRKLLAAISVPTQTNQALSTPRVNARVTKESAPKAPDMGYAALFRAASSRLPEPDQRRIYALMGLKKSAKAGMFTDESGCPPAPYRANLADLNQDGTPEVFISGGNTCSAGMTGLSLHLFVKDLNGEYRANLGFPAAGYKQLSTRSRGYADIRVASTGFCDAIWRWDGLAYSHAANIPTAPGGCDRLTTQ